MGEAEIRRSVFRHDARNLQLKRRLAELGVDFRQAHPTICRFRAPGEPQATQLAHQLEIRGFRISKMCPARLPKMARCWFLTAQVVQSIECSASHEFTDAMVRCAAEFSCAYEGWRSSTQ